MNRSIELCSVIEMGQTVREERWCEEPAIVWYITTEHAKKTSIPGPHPRYFSSRCDRHRFNRHNGDYGIGVPGKWCEEVSLEEAQVFQVLSE